MDPVNRTALRAVCLGGCSPLWVSEYSCSIDQATPTPQPKNRAAHHSCLSVPFLLAGYGGKQRTHVPSPGWSTADRSMSWRTAGPVGPTRWCGFPVLHDIEHTHTASFVDRKRGGAGERRGAAGRDRGRELGLSAR